MPKSLKLKTPIFCLSDIPLPWVNVYDVIISDDNYDDVDIRRQTRALYAIGNSTVRKLENCPHSVNIRLFDLLFVLIQYVITYS